MCIRDRAYFLGDETLDSNTVRNVLNRLKQSHTTYIINQHIVLAIPNLVQTVLRNIRFQLSLIQPRHDLIFAVKAVTGRMKIQETIAISSLKVFWEQYLREDIEGNTVYRFVFPGQLREKESIRFRSEVSSSGLETINVTVTTKSRDCWLLDGTYLMDGTKKLDSIYREEVL